MMAVAGITTRADGASYNNSWPPRRCHASQLRIHQWESSPGSVRYSLLNRAEDTRELAHGGKDNHPRDNPQSRTGLNGPAADPRRLGRAGLGYGFVGAKEQLRRR
jgi:hypothetical protein